MNIHTIAQLLDIADPDSSITDIRIEGHTKFITVSKNIPRDLFCPLCGSRLHSKGRFRRHPNDQILQDGYLIDLTVIGRRWKCSNPDCSYTCTDQFDFLEKRKRTSRIIPLQIIMAFKDIHLSCAQIARRFHVSDTYAHQLFLRYVDLPRKRLTKYICIDEVFLNLSPSCKYALVIMDFLTGDILDIVESRRKNYTESYFLAIPKSERDRVEFLCCDMYDPYINYTAKYFIHARAVTDSFHVLQWLLRLIRNYINSVKRKYQMRDRQRLTEKNESTNQDQKSVKDSKEVYILKNAGWVLLLNPSKWTYHEPYYNHRLQRNMDTYNWETEFLALDDDFKTIRDLKDLYEEFNENFINDLEGASKRLDELIRIYHDCDISLFHNFSSLLKRYHDSIVASFTYIPDDKMTDTALRRLSNGPLESFNNIPSSLRSQSHGIHNFRYTRNRILWSMWEDAPIKGIPYTADQIRTPGRKRGSYTKKEKENR
jgi:transposase